MGEGHLERGRRCKIGEGAIPPLSCRCFRNLVSQGLRSERVSALRGVEHTVSYSRRGPIVRLPDTTEEGHRFGGPVTRARPLPGDLLSDLKVLVNLRYLDPRPFLPGWEDCCPSTRTQRSTSSYTLPTSVDRRRRVWSRGLETPPCHGSPALPFSLREEMGLDLRLWVSISLTRFDGVL